MGPGLVSPSAFTAILHIADLFQPFGRNAVESFLNGNVGHGRCRRTHPPVSFSRRELNIIARHDLPVWPAGPLRLMSTAARHRLYDNPVYSISCCEAPA